MPFESTWVLPKLVLAWPGIDEMVYIYHFYKDNLVSGIQDFQYRVYKDSPTTPDSEMAGDYIDFDIRDLLTYQILSERDTKPDIKLSLLLAILTGEITPKRILHSSKDLRKTILGLVKQSERSS